MGGADALVHVYDRGVNGKIKTTNMLMAEMETELVQPRSPIGDVWEAKSEATLGKIARLNSKIC